MAVPLIGANEETVPLTERPPLVSQRTRIGPGAARGSTGLGMESKLDLQRTAIAKPQFRWSDPTGDRIYTCELYREGGVLMLHLICPGCGNENIVNGQHKAMEWSNGLLSVEPFGCEWELDVFKQANTVGASLNLCGLWFGIDKGRAILAGPRSARSGRR